MSNAPTILVVENEEDSVLLLESALCKARFVNPAERWCAGSSSYLATATTLIAVPELPAAFETPGSGSTFRGMSPQPNETEHCA